jgi:hypothetical protein
MESKNEPHRQGRTDDNFREPVDVTTTSLTDLIDEMDRAAFRRSLAGRDHNGRLSITDHTLEARSKG